MPSVVFRRDHLRFTSGIICGSGSFAVQFGDHLRSGDHLRRCTAPWHLLTLTEPVPEAFELPASDLPQKIVWRISEEEQLGDSDVFLHDVVFLIDRQSRVARSTGKVSRGKFQN